MKNLFKILVFVATLAACQDVEKVEPPENLIPEDQMIDILVDLAKIDAAMNLNQKAYKEKGFGPRDYIFEKYGIDSVRFAENNVYYMENPQVGKRLYEAVRDTLDNQIVQMDSLQLQQDSLRQASKMLKKDTISNRLKTNPAPAKKVRGQEN